VQALLAIALWIADLQGLAAPSAGARLVLWHADAMLFGFAGAAIAGFLLTSVPVWTGHPAVRGARLAALVALWLAARIASFFAGVLPFPWIAAVLDAAFFALLALAITSSLVAARSHRNYAFPLLLLLLAGASLMSHLEAAGAPLATSGAGLRLALGVLVLLVTTLGGRLIPLFTAAAMKRAGIPGEIAKLRAADLAAGPLLAAFVAADTLAPDASASGVLALLAALALALRAKGWGLRLALRDPLLWSMHVAYLWAPLGLAALGLHALGFAISRSVATHALTAGAIGGMILAVMSRVALGHTGRALRAPPGMTTSYLCVLAAALTRTLGVALLPSRQAPLLLVAGGLWIAAFAIFLAIYAPILLAPRVDGRPG